MAMKNKFQLPKMTMCPVRQMNKLENISDLETIFNFVAYREIMAMKTLQKATLDKMKEGKDFYDVWMKEDNDLVQSLATAYGERKVLEFCIDELQSMPNNIRYLMTKVFELYGLVVLQQNIAFHLLEGGMNNKAAASVPINIKKAVAWIHPHAMKLTENFGIAEHLLTSPIA